MGVIKEGFCKKRSKHGGSIILHPWYKRYFKLEDGVIMWSMDKGSPVLGKFSVSSMCAIELKKGSRMFVLYAHKGSNLKTYQIQGETKEDTEEWMSVLKTEHNRVQLDTKGPVTVIEGKIPVAFFLPDGGGCVTLEIKHEATGPEVKTMLFQRLESLGRAGLSVASQAEYCLWVLEPRGGDADSADEYVTQEMFLDEIETPLSDAAALELCWERRASLKVRIVTKSEAAMRKDRAAYWTQVSSEIDFLMGGVIGETRTESVFSASDRDGGRGGAGAGGRSFISRSFESVPSDEPAAGAEPSTAGGAPSPLEVMRRTVQTACRPVLLPAEVSPQGWSKLVDEGMWQVDAECSVVGGEEELAITFPFHPGEPVLTFKERIFGSLRSTNEQVRAWQPEQFVLRLHGECSFLDHDPEASTELRMGDLAAVHRAALTGQPLSLVLERRPPAQPFEPAIDECLSAMFPSPAPSRTSSEKEMDRLREGAGENGLDTPHAKRGPRATVFADDPQQRWDGWLSHSMLHMDTHFRMRVREVYGIAVDLLAKGSIKESRGVKSGKEAVPQINAEAPGSNGGDANGSPAGVPTQSLTVVAGLYHGGKLLAPVLERHTSTMPLRSITRFDEWLTFPVPVSSLPRATRLCISVVLHEDGGKGIPFGWVNLLLIDPESRMLSGLRGLNLWPKGPANPIGTCVENLSDDRPGRVFVEFDTYDLPLVFPDDEEGPIVPAFLPRRDSHRPSEASSEGGPDSAPPSGRAASQSTSQLVPGSNGDGPSPQVLAKSSSMMIPAGSNNKGLPAKGNNNDSWWMRRGTSTSSSAMTSSPPENGALASSLETTAEERQIESIYEESQAAGPSPSPSPPSSMQAPPVTSSSRNHFGSFAFLNSFSSASPPANKRGGGPGPAPVLDEVLEQEAQLREIVRADPLTTPSRQHQALLWKHRHSLTNDATALPKFLMSVDYLRRADVTETYTLLRRWVPPEPESALELLGGKFADVQVRGYAVKCIEQLEDEDLARYMLQLVQVLKLESTHDSPLARFLLRRALGSHLIGHQFFWHLKAEMHVPEIQERYGLLLTEYLKFCGQYRAELVQQFAAVEELQRISLAIKAVRGDDARMQVLKQEYHNATFTDSWRLAINPRVEAGAIKVEKCKFMDSKKLPLWVVAENHNGGPPIYIIFKSGDDLRQDMLTLQMLRLMDQLWQQNGLNLCMNPYGCVATGDEQGMLQVVSNAETTSAISKAAGGGTACFREDPIANWLREHNPSDEQYDKAVQNFIKSTAAYCVGTCVMGIGDRHNDNIMIKRTGELFHIDFGHFLGNFKSKFGFKRERAKFVFTPDYAYVMGGTGGEGFKHFVQLCQQAFLVLRRNANLFITLFELMLPAGIPELQTPQDIDYLRESFLLGLDDEEAGEVFVRWIFESLNCKSTQLNNAIHTWVH